MGRGRGRREALTLEGAEEPLFTGDLAFAAVVALFVLLPLAFLGLPFLWARRVNRGMAAAGAALGLHPHGSPPRHAIAGDSRPLRGDRSGRTVQLRLFTVAVGRSSTTYTALEVPLPGVDPAATLRLQKEGLGQRLVKALGGQDVETGNPDFDAAFRIQASDAARARAALDLAAQDAIARLPAFVELRLAPCVETPAGEFLDPPERYRRGYVTWGSAPGLQLARPGAGPEVAVLRWARVGTFHDAEGLGEAVPLLLRVAESVEQAMPRP